METERKCSLLHNPQQRRISEVKGALKLGKETENRQCNKTCRYRVHGHEAQKKFKWIDCEKIDGI
jgi:hypothetical protein